MKVSTQTTLYATAPGGGVHLRHPRWADFEDWGKLRRLNQHYLSPWEPQWDERHLTRLSYKARLSRFKRIVSNGEGYPFHVFRANDDRMVGACNITHVQRGVAQSAQLGYWIGEAYAKQGFGRAAVKAACLFCFDDLGLHRIEAAVQPDNAASIKVLNAVGFQEEGLARGYLKINGQWEDHVIYAKLSWD